MLIVIIVVVFLVIVNWYLFIYMVNSGYVIEVSFGYYINLFVNVFFVIVILKECLSCGEIIVVIFVIIGVLIFIWYFGFVFWVVIGMVVIFLFYGLIKKVVFVFVWIGLIFEIMIIMLFVFIYVIFFVINGLM